MLACAAMGIVAASVVLPGGAPTHAQTSPGITVERVRAARAPEIDVGDRTITIVRVDLRWYRFRFLTADRHGPQRTLPEWMRDEGLAGGINAGMFLPDGRPCGFMQSDGEVWNDRRPSTFQGVIGFEGARFGVGGRGCPLDLRGMRRAYGSVLQSAKVLVDCEGRPNRAWRTKRYSAAALGVDARGRAVMVHVRTPYRMQVLSEMLAAQELGIRGLVYMEGGPEASLVVDAEDVRVREMGSWEDGFNTNDDNRVFWDLPNVVGLARR